MLVMYYLTDKVFPVYAGVILKATLAGVTKESVPRVCGGDPAQRLIRMSIDLCSPCMRG